jgi:hypothetical protein
MHEFDSSDSVIAEFRDNIPEATSENAINAVFWDDDEREDNN